MIIAVLSITPYISQNPTKRTLNLQRVFRKVQRDTRPRKGQGRPLRIHPIVGPKKPNKFRAQS